LPKVWNVGRLPLQIIIFEGVIHFPVQELINRARVFTRARTCFYFAFRRFCAPCEKDVERQIGFGSQSEM